jgi:Lon protease-like protein
VVLFPGMPLPLRIFEERYKLMIGTCMVTDRTFGVALIRSGQEVGGPAEVYEVGTTAHINQLDRLEGGNMNLIATGQERFRLLERVEGQPYAVARVELLLETSDQAASTLVEWVKHRFRKYLVLKGLSEEQAHALTLPSEPLDLSYLIGSALQAPARLRQELLEDRSTSHRLRRELAVLEAAVGGSSDNGMKTFSRN